MGRIKDARRTSLMTKRCEACGRGAWGGFCDVHRIRRGNFGHVKLRSLPILRVSPRGGRGAWEWASLLPITKAYLIKNPPSPQIEAAVKAMLHPGVPPAPTMRPTHPRAVLYRTLAWFQNPRAQKKPERRGWLKNRYSARVILSHLLAFHVYVEERDGVGFPGDSEACCLGYVLASQWKRPRYPAGHPVPLRATTRRLLAERVHRHVGLYLALAAKDIVKAQAVERQAQSKKPTKPALPPPTLWTPPARPNRITELKKTYGIQVSNSQTRRRTTWTTTSTMA